MWPLSRTSLFYFKLQEAIKAVKPLHLWKKDHGRIITEKKKMICILKNLKIYQMSNIFSGTSQNWSWSLWYKVNSSPWGELIDPAMAIKRLHGMLIFIMVENRDPQWSFLWNFTQTLIVKEVLFEAIVEDWRQKIQWSLCSSVLNM